MKFVLLSVLNFLILKKIILLKELCKSKYQQTKNLNISKSMINFKEIMLNCYSFVKLIIKPKFQ